MSEQPGSVPDAPRSAERPADPPASGGYPPQPDPGPGQPSPSPYGAQYPPPEYAAPQHGAPGHGAPDYGAVGHGAPGYGAPGSGAPRYGFAVPGAPLGGWRDPLVNPPAGGIEGWFSTITSTVRRSLRTVVIIALLGFSLPQALFAMVATYLRQVGLFQDGAGQLDGALADVVSGVGIGLVLLVLVLALAAAVMSFASLAAIVWAVTQEAATGQPVPVDQAFRYGLRRVLPIIGWTFVAGLLVLVGLILCVLPGLYVAFGVSLTAYVVIFERGSGPIGQSFKLTHDHFGPALGRVLLSWLPFVLYSIVSEVFFGLIGVGIRAAGTQTVGDGLSLGASLALNCVEAVLAGLVGALAVICMFVTYADLRARQQPLSTPVLQAAL